jgi:hypothetical protein
LSSPLTTDDGHSENRAPLIAHGKPLEGYAEREILFKACESFVYVTLKKDEDSGCGQRRAAGKLEILAERFAQGFVIQCGDRLFDGKPHLGVVPENGQRGNDVFGVLHLTV